MLPVIEDGLNATAMNVKPGGKQPVMRDSLGWQGPENDTSRWDTKGFETRYRREGLTAVS